MLKDTLRVRREQQSYDGGDVFAQNDRLHKRFSHVFECPNTRFGEEYLAEHIRRSVEGACVLDYGCGKGGSSERMLAAGAQRVVGVDISPKNIAEAQRLSGGLTNVRGTAEFHVMDAHRLLFPDGTFDAVVGRAILHHLDFRVAVKEIDRVLKKGGSAIFVEPLWGNPVAKLYRALTPDAHTRDEMPLSREQIEWADRVFGVRHHLFCGFVSTGLALLTSRVVKNADNAVLRLADSVDRTVARTPLRFWMRQAYLVWEKKSGEAERPVGGSVVNVGVEGTA